MKRNISNIICGVVAVCGLASCADTDMINIFKDKTKNLKDYEYLNDYDALKTFSNPKASPNFKLGVALEADDYNANGLVTRLANANFMELTAGNAMKMASCVDENGNLNFENVQAFVDNAEANGVSVYGHTLAWHAQQPLKWLEKLLKDKELDIDPNAKLEKEDYSGDFVGMSKFPYYVMGYEPSIVNGCLHSENPGSWYQYFIADGISIPADGNYTAIVKVKGSVANDGLTLNCGWGWGSGESASGKLKITTDWTEQKVDFTGIPGGKKCNLVLQPGSYDGTLDITVEPMLIEKNSQLANVDDVFNGILVRGDSTGDVVFYGKGAGKLPTASAVVADIIDCVKHLKARKYLYWTDGDGSIVKPYEQTVYPIYIRVGSTLDKQQVFDKVTSLFRNARSIVRTNAPENEFAFVTDDMTVSEQMNALAALENDGIKVLSKIRISDL